MNDEKYPDQSLNLQFIRDLFLGVGCTNLHVKELAQKHDSKNQIYLTTDLSSFNIFPNKMKFGPPLSTGMVETKKKKKKGNDRIHGLLDFYWLSVDAKLEQSKHAKIIYYPQYPEARLSGFLKGIKSLPSKYLKEKSGTFFSNRLLFLGTDNNGRTIGFLTVGHESLRDELHCEQEYDLDAGLNRIELRSGSSSEERLLKKLKEIHELGWHNGMRLKNGKIIPCKAPQAVGLTLEALLGVAPNSDNAPDYEGFEVKAMTVPQFGKGLNKAVTLMTPEPDIGLYHGEIKEFMHKYGYPDRNGKTNRQNFGGSHYLGDVHQLTKLMLQLAGYNLEMGDKFDPAGQLELVDEFKKLAAGWTFTHLIEIWKNKHERAVYIPAVKRKSPSVQFQYSNVIQLCYGANFLKVLTGFINGILYYDPAIKAEEWNTKTPKIKRRNQFRIKASNIPELYDKSKIVHL